MKTVVETLQIISDKVLISLYPPVEIDVLMNFERKFTMIPQQYKEFIKLSNGLGVTECYDCRIHSLETVADVYANGNGRYDSRTDNPLLDIGTFWEDYLLIDQDNKVYLSFQGIEDPVCINMTFKEFLQKCIENDFELFWDESINEAANNNTRPFFITRYCSNCHSQHTC